MAGNRGPQAELGSPELLGDTDVKCAPVPPARPVQSRERLVPPAAGTWGPASDPWSLLCFYQGKEEVHKRRSAADPGTA